MMDDIDITALIGCAPNMTGGVDPVEWVRTQRDATVCPCGRVAVLVVRPTHLAGLCDWCAAVVCDDPGYDVCTPTEWDDE